MQRRVPLWMVAILLVALAGIAWAQGYQPNFVRNFVGPISVSGDLTADVLTATTVTGTSVISNGNVVAAGGAQLVSGPLIVGDGATTGGTFALATGGLSFTGLMTYPSTDSTGSPGNATINKPSGRSAVPTNANTVTITNSLVAATSNIQITPLSDTSSDCVGYYLSAIASGSFTLTCPGGFPVAAWKFSWFVSGAN